MQMGMCVHVCEQRLNIERCVLWSTSLVHQNTANMAQPDNVLLAFTQLMRLQLGMHG